MFDVRLRLMQDDGTPDRVLETVSHSWTAVGARQLSFTVSEKVAGTLDAPFVVGVEYSTGAGFQRPRDDLFIVDEDSGDNIDSSGAVTFKAPRMFDWLADRYPLWWRPGQDNAETQRAYTNRTPGFVLRDIITVAQSAQGWGPHVTTGFTDTADSAGNPWAETITQSWPWFTTSLSRVVDGLMDQGYCEVWTEGFQLKAVNSGTGADRTGTVTLGGPGFTRAPFKRQFDPATAIIVQYDGGWTHFVNPGAVSRFGQVFKVMSQSGAPTREVAEQNVQPALTESRAIQEELSYDWTVAAGMPRPWVDFLIGDLVTVRTRRGKKQLRVVGMDVSKDAKGSAKVRVVVGSEILDFEQKRSQRSDASVVGTIIGGSGASPTPTSPPSIAPVAPTGLHVESNTASWAADGSAVAKVALEWLAVTQAVDGSTIDVSQYEIWARRGSEALALVAATEALSFTTDLWAPADARYVTVRARTRTGVWSEFSPEISVTPATPSSIVPKAPTGLVVTSNTAAFQSDGTAIATVVVSWAAVTQATDSSPVTIQEYEVLAGQSAQRVTGTSATFTVPSSRGVAVSVRARTTLDVWGDPVSLASVTGAAPTSPLTATSAPILTTAQGVVFAAWSGLLANGQSLPNGFQHVVAELALVAAGPWTRVGSPIPRGGGGVSIKGVAGETVWVRFTPIDTLGRPGPASVSASIVVKAVEVGDIDQAITDAIEQAQADADAAQGTASTAMANASTAQAKADAAQADADALAARGTDLITNGNAALGSVNFSTFTLEVGDQPTGTAGAFYPATSAQTVKALDEYIPIDPAKPILASMWARQVNAGVASRCYFGLSPYDVDGLSIQPYHYMEQANTRTTLAAPLTAGQTTVQLTSSANWYNGATASLRYVTFWNYVDGKGKTWPAGTYSRNFAGYAQGGISGTTVTLSAPWAGATVPAGTAVSNGATGGTYMYAPGITNAVVTEEWTKFTATTPYGGVHTATASAATTAFPIATTQVRVVILTNYSVTGGTSKQRFAGVSLSEANAAQLRAAEAAAAAAAAQAAAGTAQATADAAVVSASGRNAMFHDTTGPIGVGTRAGDIWHQWSVMTVNGKLLATWRWSGTAWVKTLLDETYIPLLNIGAGTYGSLSGGRLEADSVTSDKVLVTDFTDYWYDKQFLLPYSTWTKAVHATPFFNRGIRKTGTGTQTGAYFDSTAIRVTPGDRYRAQLTLVSWSGTHATAQVGLWMQKFVEGTGWVNAGNVMYGTAPTASVEHKYAAEFVIPTDATKIRFGLFTEANMPNTTTILVADVSVRRMTAGELIVDGTLKARHIDAVEFFANSAVIEQATVNILKAGVIKVDMLEPNVGASLNLTANSSINLLAGRADAASTAITAQQAELEAQAVALAAAEAAADAAAGRLSTVEITAAAAQAAAAAAQAGVDSLALAVTVSPTDVRISRPGSPVALHLSNTDASFRRNGVAQTWWDENQMVVPKLKASQVVVGQTVITEGAGRTTWQRL